MRLPSRVRMTQADWAFAAVTMLIGLGTIWWWHRPAVRTLREQSVHLADRRAAEMEFDELEARLKKLETDAAHVETRLVEFEQHVLVTDESSAYLEPVSVIQDRCQVEVRQLTPGPTRVESTYLVRPVEIVAVGEFEDLFCFLHAVETAFTGAQIRGVTLASEPDQSECTLSVSVSLYAAQTQDDGADGNKGPAT